MVAQGIILLRRHFVAKALLDIVIVNVTPNDGCFAQSDDVHETLVFVAPGLRNTKSDLHIGLFGQSGSDAIAGCSESAQDMRRELPSEH